MRLNTPGLVYHRDRPPNLVDACCNKLVPAQSAEEGVVEFVIPASAKAVALLVRQADESTEIPVDLSSKPRG